MGGLRVGTPVGGRADGWDTARRIESEFSLSSMCLLLSKFFIKSTYGFEKGFCCLQHNLPGV